LLLHPKLDDALLVLDTLTDADAPQIIVGVLALRAWEKPAARPRRPAARGERDPGCCAPSAFHAPSPT
jgi:hypothetical protein